MAQTVMMEPKAVEAVMNMGPKMADATEKKNRIQVSNTKKPFFFYLNLAKRYIKQHNDVELSALGMAIPTVVTIAEILKSNGVAVEKKVLTSTVGSKDENKGRLVQKAKLEIILEKSDTQRTTSATNNQKGATDSEKVPASTHKAKVPSSANITKAPASAKNEKTVVSSNEGKTTNASENTKIRSATENTKSTSVTDENTESASATESQRIPQCN